MPGGRSRIHHRPYVYRRTITRTGRRGRGGATGITTTRRARSERLYSLRVPGTVSGTVGDERVRFNGLVYFLRPSVVAGDFFRNWSRAPAAAFFTADYYLFRRDARWYSTAPLDDEIMNPRRAHVQHGRARDD